MPEQTNTIKRLYDILNAVIDYGDSHVSPASSASIAWTGAFEMSNSEGLDDLLCGLIASIGEYERLVGRDNRINKEVHLIHIARIKSGLLGVNSGRWDSFRKTFDDRFLDVLPLMSENLSAHRAEEIIPEEELASLQSDVEQIIKRVEDSALDPDIKTLLLEGLVSVQQAIRDYRIFGADGLRQALARNEDSLLRNYEDLKRASETVETRNVIRDFLNILKKVDYLVSVGLKIKQLAGPVIERLMLNGGS